MRRALPGIVVLLVAAGAAAQATDEERACKVAKDCVAVMPPCSSPFAVNVAHREVAMARVPKQGCLSVIMEPPAVSCTKKRCMLATEVGSIFGASPLPDPTGTRYDKPAEHYARFFDDPRRDRWQKPAHVIELLEITSGMTVVDLGAGTGYFEPHLSRAVGPRGRVHAIDVELSFIDYLRDRAAREKWPNVRISLAERNGPLLAPASVDRVLLVDTWHHIDGREDYARRLAGALRTGGRVIIIEVTPGSPHGPAGKHRLAPKKVVAELEAAGLTATVVKEKLPRQYVVVGTKR